MGLLRRRRAAPTTTLDLGAVTVDWPGHLAAVTQLAQLQSASTDLPSRAEPSRPLLLRHVVQLIVTEVDAELKFMPSENLRPVVFEDEVVEVLHVPVDRLEVVAVAGSHTDVVDDRISGLSVWIREAEFR